MLLISMRSLPRCAFVLIVFLSQGTLASVLDELALYQSSELIDGRDEREKTSHLIVLGALEKINHELEPEESAVYSGWKSTRTYYLPLARRTAEVSGFYRKQLHLLGELAFECRGRTCGSSSYWANRILDKAILYGPEQFQDYQIFSLYDDSGYLAVYVGQRATRKIYVHIEHVRAVPLQSNPD